MTVSEFILNSSPRHPCLSMLYTPNPKHEMMLLLDHLH